MSAASSSPEHISRRAWSAPAFLAWPAALAAAAIVVFQRPGKDDEAPARAWRPWRPVLAVAGVWALVVCPLAVAYPVARGGVLARCFHAAELAAIVVGLGSIILWIALLQIRREQKISSSSLDVEIMFDTGEVPACSGLGGGSHDRNAHLD